MGRLRGTRHDEGPQAGSSHTRCALWPWRKKERKREAAGRSCGLPRESCVPPAETYPEGNWQKQNWPLLPSNCTLLLPCSLQGLSLPI